ncbi:hypothetical protein CEXT_276131 [Caerostris extrusa]|uniref:Uncharacterized protein n=1 Tax=Caerostris extrusa TaxID=172846 RepID=A0AAV4WT02_CAEEX|nr:hypothetical protein CEXT_276131 [Caerostris extrusa]
MTFWGAESDILYPITPPSPTPTHTENGCRRCEYHTRTREQTVLLHFSVASHYYVLLSWVVKKDPNLFLALNRRAHHLEHRANFVITVSLPQSITARDGGRTFLPPFPGGYSLNPRKPAPNPVIRFSATREADEGALRMEDKRKSFPVNRSLVVSQENLGC